MSEIIQKNITINAPISKVWKAITDIDWMVQWMGEPELDLEIVTDWKVGSPISIKGFHHAPFENKGTVLEYSPEHVVSYNFVSSLSHLPDIKENYAIIRFELSEQEDETILSLTLSNFPTDTIYQHLNFYWSTTLELLKEMIEN